MSDSPQSSTEHFHLTPKKSGRVRITVMLLVVAILVVTATAATQYYMAYRLPDPETADLDGLFRWLVTVDLKDYPPETHRALVRRLEEKLDTSIDFSKIDADLSDEYRCRLWSNIEILLRPWFFDRMEQYYAADPSEKIKVLDRLLDQSEAWEGIVRLAPPGEIKTQKPDLGLTLLLLEKIQEWKQTSPPEEAKRLNDFVTILKARWVLRKIPDMKLPKMKLFG